jgi:hypothetical protein
MSNGIAEGSAFGGIKTKMHRAGYFIDILPSGPGCPDEFQLQISFIQYDGTCNSNHSHLRLYYYKLQSEVNIENRGCLFPCRAAIEFHVKTHGVVYLSQYQRNKLRLHHCGGL